MEIKLMLTGETPSKKNSRINTRSGRSFPNKRYTNWHKHAKSEILQQVQTVPMFEDSCSLNIVFFHGDLRRRDSDNMVSSILDLLVDSKIISDDNWQIIRRIEVDNFYDKNNPRCCVLVKTI